MQTLITTSELKKYTPTNYGLDPQVINGIIETAEVCYIKPCLGTDFYNELILQVNTNTLTPDNQTLMDNYLSFVLAWFVLSDGVTYMDTRIDNKGLNHNIDPATAQTASAGKTEEIKRDAKFKAEKWRKEMIDFLNTNIALYPLFRSSTECCCNDNANCGFSFPTYFKKR